MGRGKTGEGKCDGREGNGGEAGKRRGRETKGEGEGGGREANESGRKEKGRKGVAS